MVAVVYSNNFTKNFKIMKTDEIEVIDFESEVEVLGVDNVAIELLENENAFIVDMDVYVDSDALEIIDMDDISQDDAF